MIEHIKPKAVISETIDNWLISTKGKQQSNNLSIIDYRASLFSDCFANTKQRVDEITDYLKDQGLKVAKIHGDITPRERNV